MHSEWQKLHRVLAILDAIGLKGDDISFNHDMPVLKANRVDQDQI